MQAFFFGSYIGLIIFLVFIFCWPAAYIAGQKNRSMLTWFFAGFLFGPMAVLMVGFSPALPPEDDGSSTPPRTPNVQQTMPLAAHAPAPFQSQGAATSAARAKPFCPGCGDPLAADAMFCQSCGRKTC